MIMQLLMESDTSSLETLEFYFDYESKQINIYVNLETGYSTFSIKDLELFKKNLDSLYNLGIEQ